jgi:hypothetical protein
LALPRLGRPLRRWDVRRWCGRFKEVMLSDRLQYRTALLRGPGALRAAGSRLRARCLAGLLAGDGLKFMAATIRDSAVGRASAASLHASASTAHQQAITEPAPCTAYPAVRNQEVEDDPTSPSHACKQWALGELRTTNMATLPGRRP